MHLLSWRANLAFYPRVFHTHTNTQIETVELPLEYSNTRIRAQSKASKSEKIRAKQQKSPKQQTKVDQTRVKRAKTAKTAQETGNDDRASKFDEPQKFEANLKTGEF